MTGTGPAREEVEDLLAGRHSDPHRLLGVHDDPEAATGAVVVRTRQPSARQVSLVGADAGAVPMGAVDQSDLYECRLPVAPRDGYRFEIIHHDGRRRIVDDPYRFIPSVGDMDMHLFGEGRHDRLWHMLGADRRTHQGAEGVAFAVWAPNAKAVRVVGDFNDWDGRVHPLRRLGSSGVWELFIPDLEPGARYKYELVGADDGLMLRADPMARAAELPPANASIILDDGDGFEWSDQDWIAARGAQPFDRRLSVYEVHLGSWRRVPEQAGRWLSYREAAEQLVAHVVDLGFTHIELLPVAEHPYTPSWGYQVTGYYAPTARYGSPDDLRLLIDTCHAHDIGVIIDWVPAHFPRDEWALARFDGTALYEHADPRQGEQPDWGTLVFNYARTEVRNFLVANARYWFEEFHIDGLRVDAVASMLYLDYSREAGEWVPNEQGGRENLTAISLLQEMNSAVHQHFDGVMTIAEESTAWGGVSRPVDGGGLGFTHKWNMGWMHDTLDYFSTDPIHRRDHHGQLTFGLMYVWTENFVSPLSHDEVVHGKGSLVAKMAGDRWQQFANLRALYGWMWSHPGKQLLFMGCEFGQIAEWDVESSLEWHCLESGEHLGIMDLVRELNRVQASRRALWGQDFSADGFEWIEGGDQDQSVFAFVRRDTEGDEVVCVANLTPTPRPGYRLGVPRSGEWTELLTTDEARFGGTGMTNGSVDATDVAHQGQSWSIELTLPPLAMVWLG